MPDFVSSFAKYSKDEIDLQIKSEESKYISQIKNCAERIMESGAKICFLAGGSCSGKTTTAKYLCRFLSLNNKKVYAFSTDDFFFNEEVAPTNPDGTKNYDKFSHTDSDYIVKVLRGIYEEKKVFLPTFDFNQGRRTEETIEIDPKEYDVIILEGIHALNDKIINAVPSSFATFKVYLSLNEGCDIDENTAFSKNDLRFFRRLIRDYKHRFSDAERTMGLWRQVIKEENENITPFIKNAQMTISSHFDYEVCVEKDQVINVLNGLSAFSIFNDYRDELLKKLALVPSLSISLVPNDSVINEFIL